MSSRLPRLTLVQSYLPAHRMSFYRRLADDLAARDIELVLAHGSPVGDAAHRADACAWDRAVPLGQRVWRLGSGRLVWRRLGPLARRTDALVLEHRLTDAEAYAPLLRSSFGHGPPVGFWGTGTAPGGRRPGMLPAALTRFGDWFFADTEDGRRGAEELWGFPPDRITVVRSAVDTRALREAAGRVTADRAARLARRHGLAPGRTALFTGGLDGPQRVPFLLAAADRVARQLPGFRLLVAGDGAERPLVERAAAEGAPVVWTGPVPMADKAALGALSQVMLLPGAVGPAAVEALALATPVVTVRGPAHGPEFGYLAHGRNALIARDGLQAYADAVAALLRDGERLASLRAGCRADADRYTVEGMSRRFVTGARRLLALGG